MAGWRAVAGALPDGVRAATDEPVQRRRIGPARPTWAASARIAGPWPSSCAISRCGWDVFRSARTGGSTSESSTAASATARTSPSAKGSPQTLFAPRPSRPTSGGSNNSTATWSRSGSWNCFPPWGLAGRPGPNGHRHRRSEETQGKRRVRLAVAKGVCCLNASGRVRVECFAWSASAGKGEASPRRRHGANRPAPGRIPEPRPGRGSPDTHSPLDGFSLNCRGSPAWVSKNGELASRAFNDLAHFLKQS